jgi:hypothetical protein
LKTDQLTPSEHGTAENKRLALSEIRTNDPDFVSLEAKWELHWSECHEHYTNHNLRGSRYAAGEALSKIRSKLAHGNWKKWLEERKIARSTADDIMRDFRRIADEVKPSDTVLHVAMAKSIGIAEKKYSKALKAHKAELESITDPEVAEKILATIEEESQRKSKRGWKGRTDQEYDQQEYKDWTAKGHSHLAGKSESEKIQRIQQLASELLGRKVVLQFVDSEKGGKVVPIAG